MPTVNVDVDLVTTRGSEVSGWILVPGSFRTAKANDFTGRIGSGKLSHSDMDNWLVEEFLDWSGGSGQKVMRSTSDRTKYYSGLGIESAIAGELTLIGKLNYYSTLSSSIYSYADFGSYVYAGAAIRIVRYDPATDSWSDSLTSLPASTVALEPFNGKLWAALGNSQDCRRLDTPPDTWTTVTGVKASAFVRWRDKLWRAYLSGVYSTVDGTTWSSAVNVGDPGENIVSLAVLEDVLLVGKPSGLYGSSDGATFKLIDPTKNIYDKNYSGMIRGADAWLYYPMMNDLFRVNGISGVPAKQRITPQNPDDPIFGYGEITALSVSPKFVYVAMLHPTTLKATLLKFNGLGWSVLAEFPSTGAPVNVYFSRLAGRLFVCEYARNYAMRVATLNDLSYPDYPTSGGPYSIKFSKIDNDLAEVPKAYKDLIVVSEGLSSTTKISVYYMVDDSGTWVLLGDVTTSPQQVLPFGSGEAISAKQLWLRFDFSTTDSSKTPKLKEVYLRYMPRPATIYAVSAQIVVEDNIKLLDGTKSSARSQTLLRELMALVDSKTPIILDTPDNLRHRVFATSIAWQEVEVRESEE